MPFDPTKPANNSDVSSQEIRDQLNSLKALIDAIPAGPPGPEGPAGPAFSNVQIGSVTTVDPLTPAAVSVSVFGNNVELSFSIPRGETGPGVSFDDMTNAITTATAGTAQNPGSVSPLGLAVSDPPTQAEIQQIVAKLDELIAALKR